jgi:hypothetical protein
MIGIAPATLIDQVRNTAAWALDGPVGADTTFRAALREAAVTGLDYFRLLLAAHHCTVATFVPTDVDVRIRHHTFANLTEEELGIASNTVDEACRWNVGLVSARIVAGLSGHDGEWMAVRAGALGRALSIGAEVVAARLSLALDDELAREHRTLVELEQSDPLDWLRAATTVAHNLGDLSRVVEGWPDTGAHTAARARFARLGHAPSARFGAAFARAGAANKAIMADENHRFLALRKPRALRMSRDLLLPIGPFFDGWGRTVATHSALDERDRAEVVTALLSVHVAKPASRGCLRALAAIDSSTPRGLVAFEHLLPARMRKLLSSGPVREALKTPEEAFLARTRRLATRSA